MGSASLALSALRALSPTPMTTIQDGGRVGWRRFGVTGAGAMDRLSLVTANMLVGNRPTEAAVEFAYAGGEWFVQAATCRVAIAGGPFNVTVDGVKQRALTSMVLQAGQRLRIGSAPGRVWGYLAVSGGFDMPATFGSRATHLQSGLGGFMGRAIQAGDALPLRLREAPSDEPRAMEFTAEADAPFRIVPGPQEGHFEPDSLDAFFSREYEVTWQQDRMAYRLEGPQLTHLGSRGYNIITDGVVPGCIQVPGTGLPIVLMRDAGTVGGYPKLGAVIESDLGRLAQQRPGTKIRFERVDVEAAQRLRRQYLARLQLVAQASPSIGLQSGVH